MTARTPKARKRGGIPLAIVLGSVLDGVPESFVLGLTVLQGGVSVALLVGVDAQQPARRTVVLERAAHRRMGTRPVS